jgi:geranylgeranyl diphosphate/geranylgeranyl-bacteriochlorophyllide a reductase
MTARFKPAAPIPMTRTDIAVVGAGPAGASAAWRLARAGASVTLFDASHPREKPCGGGLTGRALALVRAILGPRVIPGVMVRTVRIESGPVGAGRSTVVQVAPPQAEGPGQPDPALFIASRLTLDQALVDAATRAGARLSRERVRDLAIDGAGVTLTTTGGTCRADVVLGADGAASLVRRRLSLPYTRAQFSIATGYFARGVSSTEVTIHCFADPPGYLWSFPRRDHLAIGICARADHVTDVGRLRRAALTWIERSGLAPGAVLEPYSWPIPSIGYADFSRQHVADRRWMLLGDAAGLVDPLTREGLFYALQSGHLAADALEASPDPAAAYHDRLRAELYPELERAAALQPRFFSSGFSDLLVAALERSAAVREIMIDLIAGRQPYRTLRRRLLATFETGLAWQLLQLQLRGMVSPGTPPRRDAVVQ